MPLDAPETTITWSPTGLFTTPASPSLEQHKRW
jgi:hypothetical protein